LWFLNLSNIYIIILYSNCIRCFNNLKKGIKRHGKEGTDKKALEKRCGKKALEKRHGKEGIGKKHGKKALDKKALEKNR
jgi:hypothetical protein